MNIRTAQPDMYLSSPSRRAALCPITHVFEHMVDYKFNSCSEMSFKIPQKFYNEHTQSWEENICYSHIKKGMIVKTNDTNGITRILANSLYSTYDDFTYRDRVSGTPYYSGEYSSKATLKGETEIFDIGSEAGYKWNKYSYIDTSGGGYVAARGGIIDGHDNKSATYNRLVCPDFIPVHNNDILYYLCYYSGVKQFSYNIHFYTSASDSSYIGSSGLLSSNPDNRYIIDFSGFYEGLATPAPESGYIRIEILSHTSQKYTDSDGNTTYTIYHPVKDYIKLYSGERLCSDVKTDASSVKTVDIPSKWWVITDVNEISDKLNFTKEVSLKSYEYTLSNRTFSMPEGTLPLYIPPTLTRLVNSNNWVCDKVNGIAKKHRQTLKSGIINYILAAIPTWRIGYISQKLLSPMKYRTFDKVDNANIYSFLMNEIQSNFNCFVLFHTSSKTINLISKSDVCDIPYENGLFTPSHPISTLSWENAVKEFNITTVDTNVVTSMRVHAGDDKYSLSLVNPLGTSYIYNFDSMNEYMDYTASTTVPNRRTLNEAINTWKDNINESTFTYRTHAKKLIQANMDMVKAQTLLSQRLTEYRTIADQINIELERDYANQTSGVPNDFLLTDVPRTPESMKSGSYAPLKYYENYSTKKLYDEILAAAIAYDKARSSFRSYEAEYYSHYESLQEISKKLSIKNGGTSSNLDPNTGEIIIKDPDNIERTFMNAETTEINYYITEGDWSSPNVTFKDAYDAEDIYNVLLDVYMDAKEDLDNIYSRHTYEFEVTMANIFNIPEMKENIKNIFLGNNLIISSPSGLINPVLLSVHINYDNPNDFSMAFSTDYKRKSNELRFSSLFGTINQTSVTTPAFTFDE